jgi:hypothetical protein
MKRAEGMKMDKASKRYIRRQKDKESKHLHVQDVLGSVAHINYSYYLSYCYYVTVIILLPLLLLLLRAARLWEKS